MSCFKYITSMLKIRAYVTEALVRQIPGLSVLLNAYLRVF